MNSWENLQILPMGNVIHFRRIHKNDVLFLKICVFREYLVNLYVFRKNPPLTPHPQFYKNLQILPMENVRHFRRIHKNDALFLKMYVFVKIY